MVKVNLGCGSDILSGYTNVDVRKLPGVDIVCDLKDLSQFGNGTWDYVRLSHVIEHFTEKEAVELLRKVHAKLKPFGILAVYCPNARKIAEEYLADRIPMKEFSRLLFGNQRYPQELHKMALDQKRLDALVTKCGFTVVTRHPRPNAYLYDLGVQCKKK